jgi:hypothetical protein
MLMNVSQPNTGSSLNLQQPFYQTSYLTGLYRFIRRHTSWARNKGAADGMRDQIAREFEFTSKGCAKAYQKPHPEYYDAIPYLWGFRVPDFVKFTGAAAKTTYENVGQFLAQINDVGMTDVHKIRLFPLLLLGTAFS